MTAERWQQIEDILDEVMALAEAERAARIERLCAGDRALHSQVEEMVGYCVQAQAESFLESPPHLEARDLLRDALLEEPLSPDLEAGTRVGSYTVVRLLGHGGMGEVYLAERANPHMRVALKIVKRGMDTREILQRFRYEREILARLQHQHIAQLYDGGVTDDGRPYFAMEHVEGKSLDVYCDDNACSIRERLELFATVCEAVRYAHRNFVVHRDLKPGNILVREDEAGRPQVKLLDFGIAKLLEEEAPLHTVPMTEAGSRRMTPGYAAPEQVTGGPTTASTDVYALGVILYQLLTGRRPYAFKDRSVTEIERVILGEMPGRPSTVVLRTAPGDAADHTPEALSRQRSTSPRLLHRQLTGDLDAIALKALRKEPERRYASAGEFVDDIRRYLDHRPVLAQPDSVAYRAGKFVRRHTVGVVVAAFSILGMAVLGVTTQQAKKAAQEAAQQAERADVTLGVIDNMLSRVSPDQGVTFTARDLIAAGLPELEALQDQPRAQANVLNQWGRLSLRVGETALADSLHHRALEIQQQKLGPQDPDMAESLMRLAQVYRRQGKLEEADAAYKRAIEVNPGFAQAYGSLGIFYYSQSRFDEAIAPLKKTIELMPGDYQAYSLLGAVYYGLERWQEAREMWEQSIALSPSDWVYSNLATLYYFDARYADAAYMYRKALERNDQDYQIWGYLAAAYYWRPEARDSAWVPYQRAISMAQEQLEKVNPHDAEVWSRLATFYVMIGERDSALIHIRQALDLAPEDEKVKYRASYTYERLGDRENALKWMEKALVHGYPRADIEREPGFSVLRSDARFQHILQAIQKDS